MGVCDLSRMVVLWNDQRLFERPILRLWKRWLSRLHGVACRAALGRWDRWSLRGHVRRYSWIQTDPGMARFCRNRGSMRVVFFARVIRLTTEHCYRAYRSMVLIRKDDRRFSAQVTISGKAQEMLGLVTGHIIPKLTLKRPFRLPTLWNGRLENLQCNSIPRIQMPFAHIAVTRRTSR